MPKPLWIDGFRGGLITDRSPDAIFDDAVSRVLNMLFYDSFVRKAPGYKPAIDYSKAIANALGTLVLNGTPNRLREVQYPTGAVKHLLVGTTTDLARFDATNMEWIYITPMYSTGNVDQIQADTPVAGKFTVTGAGGTLWKTAVLGRDNAAPGDFFRLGSYGNGVWYEVDSVTNNTEIICIGTVSSVASPAAAAYKIRQVFAGAQKWEIEQIGGLVAFTNGADRIRKWDGATANVEILGGLDGAGGNPDVVSAKYLTVYSERLLIAGLVEGSTDYPNRVRFCHRGNAESWIPGSATSAGYIPLDEDTDFIFGLARFKKHAIVWKERSIIRLTDVGAPRYLVPDVVDAAVGLYAPFLYQDYYDSKVFPSRKGWFKTDGFSVVQLVDEEGRTAVTKDFLLKIHPEFAANGFGMMDEKEARLHFFFPTTDSAAQPDEELVLDMNRRNFSRLRRGNITAAVMAEIAPVAGSRFYDVFLTYRTGTATTTNGNVSVLGVGTKWLSDSRIHGRVNEAGEKDLADEFANTGRFFRIDAQGDSHGLPGEGAAAWIRVKEVVSDTALILESAYPATHGSAAYTVTRYFFDELQMPYDDQIYFSGEKLFLVTKDDGKLYLMGEYALDGEDYDSYIETKEWDFGSPDMKRLLKIYLECAFLGAGKVLQVWIGRRNSKDAPVVWTKPFNYTLDGKGKGFLAIIYTARFFRFRIGREGTDDPWVLRRLGLEVEGVARNYKQILAAGGGGGGSGGIYSPPPPGGIPTTGPLPSGW